MGLIKTIYKVTKAFGFLTKSIFKLYGKINDFQIKRFKAFDNYITQRETGIQKRLGPWEKINKAASLFAKNVGLSGKAMAQMRDRVIDLAATKQLGAKYGISSQELIQQISSIYGATGRKVGISNSDTEDISGMRAVMGTEKTTEYISKLDQFGISIKEASKISGRMFSKASEYGLDFQTYSKNFLDNVSKAQTYNFKNGVKGVEAMAKKATELKFSMSEAAKFSDKVNNLEGALQVGAQLQALGGSFAQFSNPLSMLNESYTSIEDIYDRMVDMMGPNGRFNLETGEYEVNGMDKKRIKIASEAMGVSYDEMMKGINAKGRRDEIERQLGDRYDLSDNVKELIKNTGVIQNGRAGIIDENGEFKDVSKITMSDQRQLLALNKTETEDIKDIAMNVRTLTDVIAGRNKDREATYSNQEDVQQYAEKKTKEYQDKDWEKQNRKYARLQKYAASAEQNKHNLSAFKGYFDLARFILPRKFAGGGMIEAQGGEFIANKESTKNNLEIYKYLNANPDVNLKDEINGGGLIEGPSHQLGGVPIYVDNYKKEDKSGSQKDSPKNLGSSTFTARPVKKYGPEILNTQSSISNLTETKNSLIKNAKNEEKRAISNISKNDTRNENVSTNNSNSTINIAFSGSVKVEGKNGKTVDITNELIENREFISKMTQEITRQDYTNKYGKPINTR